MQSITEQTLEQILTQAARAPRKRINLNLHGEASDPVNRFLNGGVVGTYIQPHRHRRGRWELVNILVGRVCALTFDETGRVNNRVQLSLDGTRLVEIAGGEWHTFLFLPPHAVVLEIKPGPYEPHLDKEFANWAPPEGHPEAASFITWAIEAKVGQTWRNAEQ